MPVEVEDLGPVTEMDLFDFEVEDLGPVDDGTYKDTIETAGTRAGKTYDLAQGTGIPLDLADATTFQEAEVDLERKRRTLIKSIPWVTRESDSDVAVTEQQAKELDKERAEQKRLADIELERMLKAGVKEPTVLAPAPPGKRIVIPNRIANNWTLVYAYINFPSFRTEIDADPTILDGVAYAGPESEEVAKLYAELKPHLEKIVELNRESKKHPTWSAIKGIGKGILNMGLDNMGYDTSDTKSAIKRQGPLKRLRESPNLSDRVAEITLSEMSKTAWLASLPGSINAPAAIWNTATLGIAPVPILGYTPEQTGMAGVFALATLFIPKNPAHFIFKQGYSRVGSIGSKAFEKFTARFPVVGGAVATIISKPFVNRLTAIPVEFAKIKGGQLSFAVFSPENLKRVNAGEHPIAIAQDIFTSWFNVDPTTALFAIGFGFAKGLKLDTPAGRAAETARIEALRRLGLKPDATFADIRLKMGEWGKVQSTLVGKLPVQIVPPPTIPVVVTKLADAVKTSLKAQKKARKTVAKAQAVERGKRAARAQAVFNRAREQGDDAPTARRKALASIKGRLTDEEVPKDQRPQLTDLEWNTLHQKVIDTFPTKETIYTRLRYTAALEKIKDGRVLQANEIELIADLFGDKLARQLVRQLGTAEQLARTTSDILGLPRTLLATGDDSFVGRQIMPVLGKDIGDTLFGRVGLKDPSRPLAFFPAAGRSLVAFFEKKASQKAFKRYTEQIENDPYYQMAVDSGLGFTKFGQYIKPGEKAEEFASRLGAKFPLVARANRAAVIAGNWARMAAFKREVSNLERRGIPLTPLRLSRIAGALNDLTGRAGIPKGKTVGEVFDVLNKVAFSPRFAVAKIKNVVTLHHTISFDPHVRAMGFRTMVGETIRVASTVALARLFGLEVGLDPRATNFLKARVGNIHFDLLPGEGQVIRFLARMALGQTKTAAGHVKDIDRKREMLQFLKSKSSPIVNMLRLAYSGREYTGKPVKGIAGWTKEAYRNFTFLWLQDGIDAFVDEYGKEGSTMNVIAKSVSVTGASWLGTGVMVYPDSARTTETIYRDEIAQTAFGKDWIDLAPMQNRELSDMYQEELDAARQAVDVETQERADFAFATRVMEEANEAGNEVVSMLSNESKDLMKFAAEKFGLGLTVQRAVGRGDWIMNDKWFEQYQKLTAEYLDKELADLLKLPEWDKQTDADKERDMTIMIRVSKTRARLDIINKADEEALIRD